VEMLLWVVLALFALFLLFATAEAASQLLSSSKVQLVLDGLREKAAVARALLPEESGALRSLLSYSRMLATAALAAALTVLTMQNAVVGIGIGVAALLLALVLPTLLAVGNPRAALRMLLPLVLPANIVLLPLTLPHRIFFRRYKNKIRHLNGNNEDEKEEAQQIKAYLEAAEEEGLFEPGEAEMVRLVVEFSDTVVREVMTPRVDMICVDRKATLHDFRFLAAEHKLSRFPVIDGIIDNVIGVAHIKSLLTVPSENHKTMTVVEIMTQPTFVPESKLVSSLLRDFQREKQQMAIIVDEYGGTAGLVTLEDIVEELVGEIEDEHEVEEESEIVEQTDGSLVVLGHVDVDEVEKLLGVPLDDEAYETVSGLVLSHLKRIPVPGEKFTARGVEFEIIEADEKSIIKLRLSKTAAVGGKEEPAEDA